MEYIGLAMVLALFVVGLAAMAKDVGWKCSLGITASMGLLIAYGVLAGWLIAEGLMS